jgi:SAM-dependent methyltransferase
MMDRSNGYEGVAAAFLAGRGGPASAGIGASTVRAWARTLPSGIAVLDLGCGSGIPITQVLVEEGFEVYGVDASPSLAAAFRERFPNALCVLPSVVRCDHCVGTNISSSRRSAACAPGAHSYDPHARRETPLHLVATPGNVARRHDRTTVRIARHPGIQ